MVGLMRKRLMSALTCLHQGEIIPLEVHHFACCEGPCWLFGSFSIDRSKFSRGQPLLKIIPNVAEGGFAHSTFECAAHQFSLTYSPFPLNVSVPRISDGFLSVLLPITLDAAVIAGRSRL